MVAAVGVVGIGIGVVVSKMIGNVPVISRGSTIEPGRIGCVAAGVVIGRLDVVVVRGVVGVRGVVVIVAGVVVGGGTAKNGRIFSMYAIKSSALGSGLNFILHRMNDGSGLNTELGLISMTTAGS